MKHIQLFERFIGERLDRKEQERIASSTHLKNKIIKAFFGYKKKDIVDLTDFEMHDDGECEFNVEVEGVFIKGEDRSFVHFAVSNVFEYGEWNIDIKPQSFGKFHVKVTKKSEAEKNKYKGGWNRAAKSSS